MKVYRRCQGCQRVMTAFEARIKTWKGGYEPNCTLCRQILREAGIERVITYEDIFNTYHPEFMIDLDSKP